MKTAELRADTIKSLTEKRAGLVTDLQTLIDTAKAEIRAFTEEEDVKFQNIEQQIKDIDRTLAAEKRAMEILAKTPTSTSVTNAAAEEKKEAEIRAFMDYVNSQCGGKVSPEYRSGEQNITMSNNGAVIPTTIAQMIINTVKEMCPIFSKATMFAVKGTLKVPVWGNANSTHNITVGYQSEFTDITADAGAFTSVDLTGYLAGALTLIGKSVINNSEIDVLNFIVTEMSKQIVLFLEKELLIGTSSKAVGALSTSNTTTLTSTTTITADDLITVQSKIPTTYQTNACWTMSPATFAAIRKLKDSTGHYLLQTAPNVVGSFPFMLLGKPVYLSDNMPAVAASAKPILYGDYSGLAVNMRQQIEMQVLNEKYATQHAVGLVAWFEFDSNVIDHQKLATITMAN
jgi:HK97 family phage major capsid protein